MNTLVYTIDKYKEIALSTDNQHRRARPADLQRLFGECETAANWLHQKQAIQGRLDTTDAPAVSCEELEKRTATLIQTADGILEGRLPETDMLGHPIQ